MEQQRLIEQTTARLPRGGAPPAPEPLSARDIYDAHVEQVYRLAYRLTWDSELARDLTQDVFIRVFERIGDFRGDSKLSTWIHSVAVSVILNKLRSRRRRDAREAPLEDATPVAESPTVGDPDLRERLHRSIDELPEEYRIPFVMREIEGYSYEEIGEGLGVTPQAVRVRFHRAKQKLRTALRAYAEDAAL